MIEPATRERLRSYNGSSFPILSVRLSSNSIKSPNSGLLLSQLHSLIHQGLTPEDRALFVGDIERIEKYLSEEIPHAKTIIFFSANNKLWQVIHLEYFLPSAITIDTSPDTKALDDSLKKYTKYLVILVDREKACMFTVGQGEIIRWAELGDKSVPQLISSTGRDGVINQSDKNFRRNELLLRRHINTIAKAIDRFMENDTAHFIVVGGHREIFKKVIDSLHPYLRSKVAGTFVSELNISAAKMLDESKKVAAKII